MQRIFKHGGIQHIILTPDKELNILIYRMPSYVIIYKKLCTSKMVRFFWPTLYIDGYIWTVVWCCKKLNCRRVNAHRRSLCLSGSFNVLILIPNEKPYETSSSLAPFFQLSHSICQIIAFDKIVPLVNALVLGILSEYCHTSYIAKN